MAGVHLRWVSLLDGGSDLMSEIHHTAVGQRSRTTGLKKRGGGEGRFIERRHWVRWSLGQSRPFLGSWVAGADYRNVTPGLPSTDWRQEEDEKAGGIKERGLTSLDCHRARRDFTSATCLRATTLQELLARTVHSGGGDLEGRRRETFSERETEKHHSLCSAAVPTCIFNHFT